MKKNRWFRKKGLSLAHSLTLLSRLFFFFFFQTKPFLETKKKNVHTYADHRTCEPWILTEAGQQLPNDFRGARMRLLVACYQRAEAKFESVEKLVEMIHDDARVARRALAELEGLREDPWLVADE